MDRGPLVPRYIIRRLYRPVQPDVEEERRVQQLLYGERRNVQRVDGSHIYREAGENLVAMDRATHERLHRGESPHPYP